MVSVFNTFPVLAAVFSASFNVVNPQFSGSAAAELVNEFEWLVTV